MPLVQVIWIGVSAGLFAIWICLLASLNRSMRATSASQAHVWTGTWRRVKTTMANPASLAILGRVAGLTIALLMLAGLGLLLWPP